MTDFKFETLLIKIDHSICRVILNRPAVKNSFQQQMISELTEFFQKIPAEKNIRSVILSGAGNVFCSGADLGWMKSMASYTELENKNDSIKLFEMFKAIHDCPCPVITEVQGAAFGGALGLIACSDYVVALEKTNFCFSEVRLGLAPAVISYFILPKVVPHLVRPLMLSGQVFTTSEALRLGLVHRSAQTQEELHLLSEEFAFQFNDCGPQAVRKTKEMLNQLNHLDFAGAQDLTTTTIAQLRVGPEGQEGLAAFFEKRKAHWKLS